jgi:cyclase
MMTHSKMITRGLAAALCLSAALPALAQQAREPVDITRTDLGNGIYMLEGAGGNVGVSIGEDGVFIIDDQFDYMSESILANIRELSDGPLKYVINTHWHGDHIGGNENMHKAGATIIASDNVRTRMKAGSTEGRVVPPASKEALPALTFNDHFSLHMNGQHVRLIWVPSAHTDGDSMVRFLDSNIVHTGDTFLVGRYPFIDTNSGGSALGYIGNLEKLLSVIDDETIVMPGHGAVSAKADVQKLYDMLIEIQSTVVALRAAGQTDAQILEVATFPQWKDMEWHLGSANKLVTALLAEL